MTVTRKENCLGLRGVKSLGQGHIASKWQSRDLDPALSASELGGSEVLGSRTEGGESGGDGLL